MATMQNAGDSFKFDCPNCSQSLEATRELIGENLNCPTCGKGLEVPTPKITRIPNPNTPIKQQASHAYPRRQNMSGEIITNVKQGAIIGGWVCFGIGILCMLMSLFTFFLYVPIFLVAFILSIVAMSQRRVLGGIILLLATLTIPSVLGIMLFSTRASKFAKDMSKSIEVSSPPSAELPNDRQSAQPSDIPKSFRDAVKKGFENAQHKSDLNRLEELRKTKNEFNKKLNTLKSFQVIHANFSKKENMIGRQEPIIELTVQNNSEFAVKRAYFRGVLQTPGRRIPWIDDTFNYEISGGVQSHFIWPRRSYGCGSACAI